MARSGESRFLRGLGVRVVGSVDGYGAPARALKGVLAAYLRALRLPGAALTLTLVGGRDCRALNRRFRGKDRATDVLSFPAREGRPAPGFEGYLGDLALCPPFAWRERGRFFKDFGDEVAFLVLHGLLHLGGRHHDTPADEDSLWRLSRRLHPLGRPWSAALRGLAPLERTHDAKP